MQTDHESATGAPRPALTLPEPALAAIRRGETIEAIKLLRESHGLGLQEAKAAVDRYQAGDRDVVVPPGAADEERNGLPASVLAALDQGEMIEAIKRLREAHGLGLKEAKDRIDAHRARHPGVGARIATVQGASARAGLLRWFLAALAVAGVAWLVLASLR